MERRLNIVSMLFYELEKKAKQQRDNGNVNLDVKASYIGSKIFEAEHVTKSFGNIKIVEDFNYIFARFEKMGIVGNNGTGKSTFIKNADGGSGTGQRTLRCGRNCSFRLLQSGWLEV